MNHAFVAALAEAGHTAESLADRIGVHPKTVARWANPGHVPQSRHRATVAELLARDAEALWPDAFRRREPVWFRPWVDLEREALTLRSFQLAWVPGLLQTEAYARATLAGGVLTPDAVDEFTGARSSRQSILDRESDGPLLIAVLDEGVLRRRVGDDRALMAAQLTHLLGYAETDTVQLQIVPADAPSYPGLDGPFTIADLPDGSRVAHVDSAAQAQILDQTSELVSLERRWERIRGEALPRGRSLDLLREAAASWT
ncbi:Scr1 family TA system antitoxin-like transcriptional regulator [Micromonospora sp. NPDC005197]|uniref:Scr1 family TA system antitoxin-like transcriptional regulator n=1 Tax=Micromonospora sp. NPDC005197 TaxID=3157020 RepID=UPI0033BC3894